MRKIAKKCGLEKEYLGYYSFFSEATHSLDTMMGGGLVTLERVHVLRFDQKRPPQKLRRF